MPIDEGDRRRVVHALRGARLIEAPAAETVAVTRLEGGLGRRTYLADADGRSWVVRLPAEERPGALGVVDEAQITEAAAELGIAPRVCAAEPATGVLITEHLATAKPLAAERLRAPENAARLARVLRRLHTIRRPYRAFEPESLAARYTRAAGKLRDAESRERAAELHALASDYRNRFPTIVLCHNDLVASNVLDDGVELKLIDFEYAVSAAPVLDLAGIAALNEFEADERWRLAEAYYGTLPVPFTARELHRVVRLVQLIAYFWALATIEAAGERGPYGAFAERADAALDKTHRSR